MQQGHRDLGTTTKLMTFEGFHRAENWEKVWNQLSFWYFMRRKKNRLGWNKARCNSIRKTILLFHLSQMLSSVLSLQPTYFLGPITICYPITRSCQSLKAHSVLSDICRVMTTAIQSTSSPPQPHTSGHLHHNHTMHWYGYDEDEQTVSILNTHHQHQLPGVGQKSTSNCKHLARKAAQWTASCQSLRATSFHNKCHHSKRSSSHSLITVFSD